MDLIKLLQDNWAVVTAAPWAFATFTAFGLILGRLWQNGVVTTLISRLALRDDRIAEYERKLEGTTPDEMLRTIADLKASLAALGDPRLLTSDQMDKMTSELQGKDTGEIFISRDSNSVDSASVYTQIRKLFRTLGWNVTGGAVWGIENPPQSGLAILTRTGDERSALEKILVAALQKAGVEYELRRESPSEGQPALQLNFSEMD